MVLRHSGLIPIPLAAVRRDGVIRRWKKYSIDMLWVFCVPLVFWGLLAYAVHSGLIPSRYERGADIAAGLMLLIMFCSVVSVAVETGRAGWHLYQLRDRTPVVYDRR